MLTELVASLEGLDSSLTRAGGGPSPQLLRLLTSTADYALVLLRMLELVAGAPRGARAGARAGEADWERRCEGRQPARRGAPPPPLLLAPVSCRSRHAAGVSGGQRHARHAAG